MKEKQLSSVVLTVTVNLLLLLATFNRAHCSFTACPVNNQEFLSINRGLLPTSNVWATSEDSSFNPVENLVTHNSQDNPPWCSETVASILGHYVEINYTEPVVITLLESSGYVNGYVSNFTIEYGMLGEELQLYTVNEAPQEFKVESLLLTDAYFTLEQPIVAQRLRFQIKDALKDTYGRICWELLMYGCRLSDGVVINSECPHQTAPLTDAMETSTVGPTSSSASCPPAADTEGVVNLPRSDEELLIIVLPVAIVTILIVLVITVVGVIVCLSCSHPARRSKKTKDSNYESVTVHMLNSRTKELTGHVGSETPKSAASFLYDSPRILSYDVPRLSTRSRPTSEGGSSDMLSSGTFEIKNPLYSIKKRQETPVVSIPNDDGNDYEMIPEPVIPDANHSTRHTSLPPFSNGKARSPDPPPSLPLRTHTYSLVKKRGKSVTEDPTHGSTQELEGRRGSKERVNESIYNKLSKVAGSDPMFQVVYDEPCNEDPDIDSSVV